MRILRRKVSYRIDQAFPWVEMQEGLQVVDFNNFAGKERLFPLFDGVSIDEQFGENFIVPEDLFPEIVKTKKDPHGQD